MKKKCSRSLSSEKTFRKSLRRRWVSTLRTREFGTLVWCEIENSVMDMISRPNEKSLHRKAVQHTLSAAGYFITVLRTAILRFAAAAAAGRVIRKRTDLPIFPRNQDNKSSKVFGEAFCKRLRTFALKTPLKRHRLRVQWLRSRQPALVSVC